MTRNAKLVSTLVLATLLLAAVAASAAAAIPPQGCCIAGLYRITYRDIPGPYCQRPRNGTLTFRLTQQPGCGPNLEGSAVRQRDGVQLTFSGAIVYTSDKCCTIDGVFQGPRGGQIQLRCHFCWRVGVFSVKGKATHDNGCVSVWEMTRLAESRHRRWNRGR